MRDLAFIGFLLALFGLGFRRPFLFVLAYVYIDVVAPQRQGRVQRRQHGSAAAAGRQREQCRPGAVERGGQRRHQRREDRVAGRGRQPTQLAGQCGSSMSSASGLLICIESTS